MFLSVPLVACGHVPAGEIRGTYCVVDGSHHCPALAARMPIVEVAAGCDGPAVVVASQETVDSCAPSARFVVFHTGDEAC